MRLYALRKDCKVTYFKVYWQTSCAYAPEEHVVKVYAKKNPD